MGKPFAGGFSGWWVFLLVGFLSSSNNQVFLDLVLNGHILAFTIALAVATGLLFSVAPAWRGTRVEPQAAMKKNAGGVIEGRGRFSLGRILLTAQVTAVPVVSGGRRAAADAVFAIHNQPNGSEPRNRVVSQSKLLPCLVRVRRSEISVGEPAAVHVQRVAGNEAGLLAQQE